MSADRAPTDPGRPFDALGVLASPAALAVFDHLGQALRHVGYRSDDPGTDAARPELGALARGRTVPEGPIRAVLGTHAPGILAAAGAVDLAHGAITPRFGILAAGAVLAVVPTPDPAQGARDLVYLGPDSLWLLQCAWSLAAGGRIAIELGTGTGYLAAALAPRYQLTVATDVLPGTAAVAALTFRLNRSVGRRAVACVADVAAGLRTGCADLVVANAPWVPTPSDPGAPRRVFADGGPTGLELPARFITEGAGLLAPGGVAVVQCLSVQHDDGRDPLGDLVVRLEREGYAASLRPVGPPDVSDQVTERLRADGVAATATLVDVVVERPDGPAEVASDVPGAASARRELVANR